MLKTEDSIRVWFAELFTRCALFLRQAGLWEQLCMLIRLNLQLNLSDSASDHYKVNVLVPEDRVSEYLLVILRVRDLKVRKLKFLSTLLLYRRATRGWNTYLRTPHLHSVVANWETASKSTLVSGIGYGLRRPSTHYRSYWCDWFDSSHYNAIFKLENCSRNNALIKSTFDPVTRLYLSYFETGWNSVVPG